MDYLIYIKRNIGYHGLILIMEVIQKVYSQLHAPQKVFMHWKTAYLYISSENSLMKLLGLIHVYYWTDMFIVGTLIQANVFFGLIILKIIQDCCIQVVYQS